MATPRILLVEDNPDDVEFLRRAFRKVGREPDLTLARDGQEAIEALSRPGFRCDLVVLDLKLPRRTGLEVLEWMKERPELRSIPVVVFSSSEEREDIERAKALGAASYLVKPGGFEQTCESARKILGLWEAALEGRPVTPEFPA